MTSGAQAVITLGLAMTHVTDVASQLGHVIILFGLAPAVGYRLFMVNRLR